MKLRMVVGLIGCLASGPTFAKDQIQVFILAGQSNMEGQGVVDLDHEKVNVHGGACAQGHPIGSTGARIIVSLIYALQQYGKQKGLAALCIGGGEATAIAIELL